MDELVEFLRARIAEDKAAARRAGETFRQVGDTGVIVTTEGDRAEECASANWAGIAEHIVRHDPARVLREVSAKWQIIASCEEAVRRDEHAMAKTLAVLVLGDMALPYADHPDYHEDWCS